jgi:hypothetical protein
VNRVVSKNETEASKRSFTYTARVGFLMTPHIAAAILLTFQPLSWHAEGRAEAEREIAAGRMKWKCYGHLAGMTPSDEVARAKLRERLNIEMDVVGFCEVSAEQVVRAEAYNARIREEVDRKHGFNAIERVWNEADQESRLEYVALRWAAKCLLVVGGVWACRRILTRWRKPIVALPHPQV